MSDTTEGARKTGAAVQVGDDPKVRACLRCKKAFPSEWSGERVCPRCKKTSGWRSGTPLRTFSR